MLSAQAIGWASSAVLVVTVGAQVRRQWTEGSSRGVSPWLFVGQLAASAGFLAYSVRLREPVFVVTNALLLVAAAIGLAILVRHRIRGRG